MSYNYFLAALLSEETKKEVITCGLDPQDPRLQHTTPLPNLHITVGYIGPIPEDILLKVSSCFKALEAFSCIQLSSVGINFYGNRAHFKRYIGLEIKDPDGKLKQLKHEAEQLLHKATNLSFRNSHRDFKPHITFQLLKQRMKSHERHLLIEPTKKGHQKTLHFEVRNLGLWYRNPKTQRYESVVTYPLKAP
jgi:2'-5' RNA ligase